MHKDDAVTRLYFYQTGLSTLHLLQRTRQLSTSSKEAFMDGYMAAVDYFIEHELDGMEPKEE